jgi:NTE family protein
VPDFIFLSSRRCHYCASQHYLVKYRFAAGFREVTRSMATTNRKEIELALQGGGAHGAFTWGVLDRLLEDGRLHIEGLSGTSAGAMNGAVVADGIVRGGYDTARERLEEFWSAVSAAGRFSPVRRSPLDILRGNWSLDYSPGYVVTEAMSRVFSPYDFNPLNINPLRDIVAEHIDFDRVNQCTDLKLFVTATNVRTGRTKIFRQPEISVDTLMASACLPTVFHAVEIDGEAYWDGGYMGNPALFPLVDECDARDMLIVQINPIERKELPKTAAEIANRVNEITFNASLIKELRSLGFLWEVIHHENLQREQYRDARVHLIHGGETMLDLSVSSKFNSEWAFLLFLRDVGREAASEWLEAHFDDIGRRSTVDLRGLFEESLRPAHLAEDTVRVTKRKVDS